MNGARIWTEKSSPAGLILHTNKVSPLVAELDMTRQIVRGDAEGGK